MANTGRVDVTCSACGVVVARVSDATIRRVAHFAPLMRRDSHSVMRWAMEQGAGLCLDCDGKRYPQLPLPQLPFVGKVSSK